MDAGAKALSLVILQKCVTKASFHPIAYFNHKLNNAQLNYSATNREMLAVI